METVQRRESKYFVITKYFSVDQIDDNSLGGVHGTYGRQEECGHGFSRET